MKLKQPIVATHRGEEKTLAISGRTIVDKDQQQSVTRHVIAANKFGVKIRTDDDGVGYMTWIFYFGAADMTFGEPWNAWQPRVIG